MSRSWRKIRVFISSTFRDMHAERDHLVRAVFPELKKLCRAKRVELTDVDLRWGVSEQDAKDGKALDICLNEIDSCRPFFVGLLGHRYGWVPSGEDCSITAAEIYHGVLHNDLPGQLVNLRAIIEGRSEGKRLSDQQINCLKQWYPYDGKSRKHVLQPGIPAGDTEIIRGIFQSIAAYQRDRSFFFFRSERLSLELANGQPDNFFENGQTEQDKLDGLKQAIKDRGIWWTDYDSIEALEENDIQAFGRKVRDILWERIQADLDQEPEEEQDWLDEEREFHDIFIAKRIRRFVGRSLDLMRMHKFCNHTKGTSVLLVNGEPGCGKSALLAQFSKEIESEHPDWLIIPHFVGASPGSTNLRLTLRRIFGELNRHGKTDQEIPDDERDLISQLPEKLDQAARIGPLVIILDAVNQFERTGDAQTMRWFPANMPENLRLVVSTLEGTSKESLLAHKPETIEVLGLESDDIELLVDGYLKEVRKEFPRPGDRTAFLAKLSSGSPLYITVALEEMRVSGAFETVAERIAALPQNVSQLFEQVLDRVEEDFIRFPGLVKNALNLIACGRQGMAPKELQSLLASHAPPFADGSQPDKLPDMLMARLSLSLDGYLFERSGVVDFFHNQLKEAVGRRWLSQVEARKGNHRIIAEYFAQCWFEPDIRAIEELPHQLIKAKDWQGVGRILCNLEFIEAKCTVGMTFGLVSDYSDARKVAGYSRSDRQRLQEFQRFIQNQTHVLSRYPDLTFQQAINQPDTSEIYKTAKILLDSRKINRPWFEWQNKPQQDSACLMTLKGHSASVTCCAVSPDGQRIISGSSDNTFKVWDINSGQELMTLRTGHKGVNDCAFSANCQRIVAGSGQGRMGEEHAGYITIWDALNYQELITFKAHTKKINCCAISPDGKHIVSASDDMTFKLWDALSGEEVATLDEYHGDGSTACVFTPDGKRIVSSSGSYIKIWAAETGELLVEIEGGQFEVTSCAISPDGRHIVAGHREMPPNMTLKIWDAESGKELAATSAHSKAILCCAISPDRERIISGSWDRTVVMRDTDSLKVLATYHHSGPVTACQFTTDGKRVVSASWDGTVKIWDVERSPGGNENKEHSEVVAACSFSPDGKRIVSGAKDSTLKIWDSQTGAQLATLKTNGHPVRDCQYSPDNRHIISVFLDTLKLWDSIALKNIMTVRGDHFWNSCGFTPDGRCVFVPMHVGNIADRGHRIYVLDCNDWKTLHVFKGHTYPITCCTVSPDSRFLVSSSYDNLRIWDVMTGSCVHILEGHTKEVTHCTISPDGKHIASVSADQTLKVWHSKTGKETASIQTAAGVGNSCSYSLDARLILLTTGDEITILDSRNYTKLAKFITNGNCILAANNALGKVAAGVRRGLNVLSLHGLQFLAPIITMTYLYQIESKCWDPWPTAFCPWCGRKITATSALIDLINQMTCRLTPEQAPCLELPRETWLYPGLATQCPECFKRLQLNPFIVDNRDLYPDSAMENHT